MGQNLSIGQGCDYKAIIEHEILHALGFYHEQSRTDRDDYVNIWWDEILPGVYGRELGGIYLYHLLGHTLGCLSHIGMQTEASAGEPSLGKVYNLLAYSVGCAQLMVTDPR